MQSLNVTSVEDSGQDTLVLDKRSTYQPPVFTEEKRLEKIRQALPTIETLFRKEFDSNHFPGLAYGIIVDGELIDTHFFGYANLQQKIPTTAQSLFRIASMSKSFTAMAIVKLRDDGKLRLDDPIEQYIPELKKTNMLTNDAPILTIRHLLTQDVGMPEDDPLADRQLSMVDAEFLAMLNRGISMSNPPGTVWEYTNLCYALLGRIISIVSQRSYQEYIKQEILHPLGMMQTSWEYTEIPPELLARGYRWECDQYSEENLLHDGVYGAMGGLISSIEDFSKYIAYHLQAWPARDDPEYGPLRRSSLREMHHPWNFIELKSYRHRPCPTTSAYCYGLIWSKNSDGVVSVNHTGGLPGFGCNWVMLPEHGIGLVSLANVTYADLCAINRVIIDRMVNIAELKSRQLPISHILAERKQQLLNVMLRQQWTVDQIDLSKVFAANFFDDKSLELRKTEFEAFLKRIGTISTVGELMPKNQLRGRFEVHGEQGKLQVMFSLSPENPPLIQELKLKEIK